MFLEKKEDIAFFNRVIADNQDLEPYFTELSVWAWIYNKDKYLELIEECKNLETIVEIYIL